jgi:aryl-alcohol dehydrogenase-like predicted oxidoreductase
MTGKDHRQQCAVIERAVDLGINWFDTAATYGGGTSESNLGRVLEELGVARKVHVATKVRLMPDQLDNLRDNVQRSIGQSLKRLRVEQISLLQVHNSITAERGDEPTSLTPADLLGRGGLLEAVQPFVKNGVVRCLGLTGIGQPEPMRQVVRSGEFSTIQVPYSLVNPSAGQPVPADFSEADYGNIIRECVDQQMGVFVIRVFAGGALVGNSPSEHTYKTRFFRLDLYQRDQSRAKQCGAVLPEKMQLREAALRFSISHPGVTSAIVGFGEPEHVELAAEMLKQGPLPEDLASQLVTAVGTEKQS